MKKLISFLTFMLIISTNANAIPSLRPAQILCTPDEYKHVGIEKGDPPLIIETHLFELSGKVTILKEGSSTKYEYGKGTDFYYLKTKTVFSNEFLSDKGDIFLVVDSGFATANFTVLSSDLGGSYFHIDWVSERYFGYKHSFNYAEVFEGSCKIMKQ